MEKLASSLWLAFFLGTAAHVLTPKNDMKEQMETEPLRSFHFSCKMQSSSRSASSSVHTLRPSDIKAVAAIGDLGNIEDSKAKHPDLLQSLTPSPSNLSYSTERDLIQANMKTILALVSRFSPSVRYYSSVGNSSAVSRSRTLDLLNQAKEIVKSMKESQWMDYHNDWKLITVFHPCPFQASISQATSHLNSMKQLEGVLDFLYEEVPKAFVNLVDSPLLTFLHLPHSDQNYVRDIFLKLCICSSDCSRLEDVVWRWSYQDALENLLTSRKYDLKDDFTVVLQTPLQETRQDNNYSTKKTPVLEKKFAALGVGLWNNMLQPVGQKQLYYFTEMPKAWCPTQENPYFFTFKNSNCSSFPVKSLTEPISQQRSFGTNIPCIDRSPSNTVPVSVHNLRPADIKVIGALGDSLTAGNGAGSSPYNVIDVLTQYRGLSWSVGGNENISTVTTLTNILREFNPSLLGFSTGKGTENTPNAYLNQAVAGARAQDIPSQAKRLIDLMKTDSKINFQEDWKLVTLFIGGNDLCGQCDDPAHYSPENFTSNIQTALDILHKEVPRVFVNMVTILHITTLRKLYQENSITCPRLIMRSLCPCVLNPGDNSSEIEMLEFFNRRYQEGIHRLIESGRYDTREDFTVVVQPFLEESRMPTTPEGLPDSSYFAPDCFHFHQKAHSQVARAVWNNMLEPLGEKSKLQALETVITLKCPNQVQPYLMTYRNSNYTYPNETASIYGSQMLCEGRVPSINPPTSVHSLKPADVQIIAALGDSLTAGNGIGSKPNDLVDMTTQYRGLSWSIGGDASLKSVTTLPNILCEFNANLTGYSTGTGSLSEPTAFLNQALPSAQAEDLPDQVKHLVKLMKNDSRINFDTDWKVITVFIGVHDLCNYCKDINHYSAVNFSSHVQEALDLLHAEVPKALVNLVEVMDLLPLRQLFLDSRLPCPTHLAEDHCSCVLPIREGLSELVMIKEAIQAYQSSLQKLVESGRYDTQEDFTVVLQPFLRSIVLPRLQDGHPDISFFAPDCFHLSQKSHSQLSGALWNNMLQPLGEKSVSFSFMDNITLSCPTLHQPFLGTYKNSNDTHSPLEPSKKPSQNWGSDLSCPGQTASKKSPTSVHMLQPSDIQVIAALGDSLTTAVGAKATGLNDLKTAWRGLSWSIGSDETLETRTTLPNILKKFNPNLSGFSTGTQKETAGFNVAEGGATAQNLPAQARELIKQMKSSPDINYKEDWKLVTILIGANDLCQCCLDKETFSVEKYAKHLQDTLDILYKELPRAFVNMVEVMELAGLRQIEREASGCVLSGESLCPCFLNTQENFPEQQEMERINRDFQDRNAMMINSGRYTKREDFAVVVQPFFRNTIMPLHNDGKPDLSFFAVDCFHFSERGHAEMAVALWNNMLEPVGHKQSYNNFTYESSKLKCPTSEHPFLFTSKNSGMQSSEINEENNGDTVPYWAVIVAATAGILAGSLIVWVLMAQKGSKRPWTGDTATEEKVTAF
ncbi:phospholipase B1, membrane-associated isoform X2 [Rhineura floridana]|uniref:phospholipase B1, membrane-associated isoform X2 n=1 Tax=Rhineura floridana TaxID=261503 RepID=UPI002AC8600B|nr:phospholipase B1, membrane-associated isoform X2 [Rhineura floridana]